jgi:biopolymer transport protein TolR
MGMSTGGSKGGPQSEINMTPMIDILLVLLIIFMVVQQSLQKGVAVQVPPVKKDETPADPNANPDQIVLEVKRGQQYFVNRGHVPAPNLKSYLTELYAPRPRKVIFIKADENVSYGDVIYAVDIAKQSRIEVVGLVPRPDATVVPGI